MKKTSIYKKKLKKIVPLYQKEFSDNVWNHSYIQTINEWCQNNQVRAVKIRKYENIILGYPHSGLDKLILYKKIGICNFNYDNARKLMKMDKKLDEIAKLKFIIGTPLIDELRKNHSNG